MDYLLIISVVMILIGAVIMAINIMRSLSIFRMFYNIVQEDTEKVKLVFRIHEVLMLFFFIGYLVVAYATITEVELVSELFVGIIFFFGAVFVYLGIVLQTKMFLSIKNQYDNAVAIRVILQDEKKNLKKTNESLSEEIKYRKEAQEEQKRLETRLIRSEKMEALGLLAGGVAHDLNNVLSGIVSYPDLLLMNMEEDSPLRKPIKTMQNSGKKAADIVHDLLTLARRGVVDKSIVDVNEITLEYLKSLEFGKLQAYHPNVSVETNLDENLQNIEGSLVQLKKIVMNLVSNAAEAQPSGGEIIISTRNQHVSTPIKGYEEIKKGDYVVFEVKDVGLGIAAEDIASIFEPFYTKKKMGRSGTGLGMAVVWGAIHDHGGYIDIISYEGAGTSFLLYFPARYEEIIINDTFIPIEEYMGSKETILVVDDVQEQRDITENILSKLNYTVTTVSSGEAACEYMKDNHMDLLILDMIMENGIDGLDTYRNIIEYHPNQKAIIVSGFSETDRIKGAQKIGAGKYIKKPYTMAEIGMAIKAELKK